MNLDFVLAGLRRWVRDGVYDDAASNFVTAMRHASKRADDQGLLTDAWRAALFGANHPFLEAGLARHANAAVTVDDARDFRNRCYTPDNATLVIAGASTPRSPIAGSTSCSPIGPAAPTIASSWSRARSQSRS